MTPKVFISHASEDKKRFVIDFAARLRNKGVDAWVDRWEMLPGDSLVDKIFEEGIKNAQAVIVVLSRQSVGKKWVREELNAALVKRISQASKLIPVVIDDCEVPECLKSTLWERIPNLQSYDVEFERILMSVFGKYEKPALGATPSYVQTIDSLPDLTSVDTLVFKTACELAIAQGMTFINIDPLLEKLQPLGIAENAVAESLEILDSRGYIEGVKVIGEGMPAFTIKWSALEDYLRYYFPEFSQLVDSVAFKIVNESKDETKSLCTALGQPKVVINTILESLEMRGLINSAKASNGDYYITDVSVELKRMLRAGSTGVGG